MSQWQKVQDNQQVLDHMQHFYPPCFPIEVRYFLCHWIEEQPWYEISDNIQHTVLAESLLTEMLKLIKQKADELENKEYFIIKIKLEDIYTKIQSIVRTKPLEMVQIIKDCLAKEEMLLKQSEETPQQNQLNDTVHEGGQQSVNDSLRNEIQSLFHKTKCTEDDLKNLQEKQESFIIKFSVANRIIEQLQQLSKKKDSPENQQKIKQMNSQKEHIDALLAELARDLLVHRIDLSKKHEQTVVSLQNLQKEILDNRLSSWKRKQQLAENGFPIAKSDLSFLQQWCDDLADLIWQNRQQIKKSTMLQKQLPIKSPDDTDDSVPGLNECITNLLSSLVTSTFILVQQPPQVLKKDARFSATVCLLVGKKLNVHMNPPQVKATIISERQFSDLMKTKSERMAKDCSNGEILNNTGTMDDKNEYFGITFKNMQLKRITRADRKNSEAVTQEKFCILFQSDFTVGGSELIFQVWTVSLPVVVTVHGSQECSAAATIFWDNAFAEQGRASFAVPDQVEWPMLADQLNMKFKHNTGKELTQENLDYIASKLFKGKDPFTNKVSWSQFNKDVLLANRSFSFWEWFYAILKLTKEHLKELWIDDTITGFISKSQAEKILASQPVGTFLLRFSDSGVGGVTIAWTGEKEVLHLAPFVAKDINIRGLADRVRDVNTLVSLYPNKPKDLVFSKYYKSNSENITSEGYVLPELKTTIPEEFKSSIDTEIKQPFSQDSFYDGNLNSVQSMDDGTFLTLTLPDDFIQMDFSENPSFILENIDDSVIEIPIDQLTEQLSG